MIIQRQYDDDALLVLKHCLKNKFCHNVIQFQDQLLSFIKNTKLKPITAISNLMRIDEEKNLSTYGHSFVLVINDYDRICSKEQLDILKYIQSFCGYDDIVFHLVLLTYQPYSMVLGEHYIHITFPPLTLTDIKQIISLTLPNNVNEKNKLIINKLLDKIYVYNPSRMFIVTTVYSLLEHLEEKQRINDEELNTFFTSIIQPFIIGHKIIEVQYDKMNNTSYHLNYLLYISYKLSGNNKKSIKIQKIYNEYVNICPNPLSFDLFVLMFKSAVEDNYFKQPNTGLPFITDSFLINITKRQFEEIDSILFGNQNKETDVL